LVASHWFSVPAGGLPVQLNCMIVPLTWMFLPTVGIELLADPGLPEDDGGAPGSA